ncbi:MAG: RagB/SusD family nutrient uptake outer membrane protein [Sphingobacteriia bacterium]|nr:MAG: RagB/SusD family nutrient uptake outer membrane protein [Sphingobacteriia bacterium]
MKKMTNRCAIILCAIMLITSCKKDFLDTKPQSEISESDIWNDPILIETFINGIYSNINNPTNGGDGVLKSAFVDEVHDQWYSFFEFNNSLLTPDNNNANWFHEDWAKLYKNIRAANLFLDKIKTVNTFDNVLTDGVLLKNRMIGEVYFLRAYMYHQLVSLYGGVPIIKSAYSLSDNFEIKRNSYADCIKFISDDCDSASKMLPLTQSGNNQGRATKGAVLTLKSRVLLNAASDLHNTVIFGAYPNPELLGYTNGDRAARWRAAKDAAKAVIDLNIYSLYKGVPAPTDSIAQNYADIFVKNTTEEDIWVRYYKFGSITYARESNTLSLVSGPNGYHLYGENSPVGELVDEYEMRNGSKFSWSDPAKATEPYKNRDPRFYASILYEGAIFKARPIDIQPLDPIGVIQVGTWQKWDNASNSMKEIFGLDTRKSPIEGFNACYTGYYLRKFINPVVDGQFQQDGTPWRYMRYAEVLLNYAEACIELNQDAEARTYINMIRKRAGMPNITESGSALRTRYRNERRIELAFEEHRFFDVRRWAIGKDAYKQFSGVDILYKMNPDRTTAAIPTIKPIVVQKSAWLNRAYFFPITRDEMNKNSLLVQNPEY